VIVGVNVNLSQLRRIASRDLRMAGMVEEDGVANDRPVTFGNQDDCTRICDEIQEAVGVEFRCDVGLDVDGIGFRSPT
jgi:hypothetical protein